MTNPRFVRAASSISSSQHGMVAHRQLVNAGGSEANMRTLVRHGVLIPVRTGLYRFSAAPPSNYAAIWAALLDTGPAAVLSHTSAAALFGLPGYEFEPHHVIAPRIRRHRQHGFEAVVHEPVLLKPRHLTEIDGIPVTTPARTLFDLAAIRTISTKRLARTMDSCLARSICSSKELDRLLRDLARRGRPGIRRIRPLIHERLGDYSAPESGAEHRFMRLLQDWGVHGFERQVDLTDDEGWVGRVDFVNRDERLVVEIDSALFHGSLTDRRIDKARRQRLKAAGWEVLAVDGNDLFSKPSEVHTRLQSALQRRRPTSNSA